MPKHNTHRVMVNQRSLTRPCSNTSDVSSTNNLINGASTYTIIHNSLIHQSLSVSICLYDKQESTLTKYIDGFTNLEAIHTANSATVIPFWSFFARNL
ncbi:hypothetical protein QL285_060914 [Trifolium repens]|nr:hypothetical protein QL285_060914 [Trifolium repens]